MKRIRYGFLAFLLAFLLLAAGGCGVSRGENIPIPEEYGALSGDEAKQETDQDTVTAVSKKKTEEKAVKSDICFFLDTSGSATRFRGIEKVYSAAVKCAAGYEERHFYGLNGQQELVEVSEQLALSGQYGNTSPVDWLEREELPYDASGINILTTDLQSGSSCSELGRWLVDTGSTGFSFYVFPLGYEGSLEFETYTSNSVLGEVSVKGCAFPDKELLLIAFGNDALVEEYDSFFQEKLGEDVAYDSCHVSLHEEEAGADSFLKLVSSRWFTENVANVEYDNTNFVYGMELIDTEDADFTCENTLLYKKSRLSANKAEDAVKAVLYAVPDPGVEVPAVAEDAAVVKVLEYDEETESYQDSDVTFSISTEPYLDGFPSAVDDPDSDKDEALSKALGGKIVEDGPVFTVTAENRNLPKGLYAVEVQLTFEAAGEITDLQDFASAHSAGLEDYSAALRSECQAETEADGQRSDTSFLYIGDGADSAFRKLLDFEKLTDELIAAGAVTEDRNEELVFRLIIDNR